ncbi:MAG: DUF1615 family protein [Cocleimonas sp.]|nr:DUF1615 family protein [Cocleimonas sp.]
MRLFKPLHTIRYSLGSFFLIISLLLPPLAQANNLSVAQVNNLVRQAEPQLKNRRIWAVGILKALKRNGFQQNRSNVCSVIAIVDQESSFRVNPSVKNLGKIATTAILKRLDSLPLVGSVIKKWLENKPTKKNSYLKIMGRAQTERDLDRIYRHMISSVFLVSSLSKIMLVRNLIENNNEINTIGSMQVSTSFAIEEEEKHKGTHSLDQIWKLRESMYTLNGGLHYGVLLLLGYRADYINKVHHFADYNAGRYASRNAGFQFVIEKLSKKSLAKDGDLLRYRSGKKPSFFKSTTEKHINEIAFQYKLRLTSSQIRKDLKKEKTQQFTQTKTYQLLRRLYRKKTKRHPPYAVIPSIQLKSEKTSRILTTKRFATVVHGRYQRCMRAR